jgi:predicted transcriptional regulator YdeE
MSKLIILGLIVFLCPAISGAQQETANTERPHMEPTLTTREEIKLVGIAVRTTNQQEMNPATAKIPGLWERFFQGMIADKVPNKTSFESTLAAYTKYQSDYTGAYDLIVGREVNNLSSIPAGMTGITIPAGKYLRFTATGPMPKALIDTWAYIWKYFSKNSQYQRAYTTDYEVHESNDKVDIYIAIKWLSPKTVATDAGVDGLAADLVGPDGH